MEKTCIIYGSSTGTCQAIADKIAAKLGVGGADVYDVAKVTADTVAPYKNVLVALFGCGDCESYGDTFCAAMGEIYDALKDSGAEFVGRVSTDGYTFDDSAAVVDGRFIGLALDDVNEPDKTDDRIAAWTESIKGNL